MSQGLQLQWWARELQPWGNLLWTSQNYEDPFAIALAIHQIPDCSCNKLVSWDRKESTGKMLREDDECLLENMAGQSVPCGSCWTQSWWVRVTSQAATPSLVFTVGRTWRFCCVSLCNTSLGVKLLVAIYQPEPASKRRMNFRPISSTWTRTQAQGTSSQSQTPCLDSGAVKTERFFSVTGIGGNKEMAAWRYTQDI